MKYHTVKWLVFMMMILAMFSFTWAGNIHKAAAAGDMDTIQKILKSDAGVVNALDEKGRTPLQIAALEGKTEVAALLLKKGAKINHHAAGDQKRTALHYAAWKGHTDTVRLLLEKGADIQSPEVDGETPLHYAAAGNLDTIHLLLKKGANLNSVSTIGTTPLYYAVLRDKEENVRLFLKKKADTRAFRKNGPTLLHLVAGGDLPVDILSSLLDSGIDVNTKSGPGYTALHYTIFRNRLEKAAILLKRGADPNQVTQEGQSALAMAAQRGCVKMTALLLKSGARTDTVHKASGATPLTVASEFGYGEIVNLLIQAKADVNHKDKNGYTPVQYAFKHGHKHCAKVLLNAGAKKRENMKGRFGPSPLLKKELQEAQALVWYLGHSGWAIKTRNHLMIFDYFSPYPLPDDPLLANGHINTEEIKDLTVTVFVTHGHQDHYSPGIFAWRKAIPSIHYLMGFEPETSEKYTFLPPRKSIKGNGMTVTTIRSNDQGVGFFVEADGVKIFHIGDHANSKEDFSGNFTAEIDYLKQMGKVKPDLFFAPVSGCAFRGRLKALRKGVFYTFKALQPATLFPMHGLNNEAEYRKFADQCAKDGLKTRFCCATGPGDLFAWFNGKVKGAYAPAGCKEAKKMQAKKKTACGEKGKACAATK